EDGAPFRAEHARAVRALELGWAGGEFEWRQPQRRLLSSIDDLLGDPIPVRRGREPEHHRLADCFGVQVPPFPGRLPVTDLLDYDLGDLVEIVPGDIVRAQQRLPGTGSDEGARPGRG